MAAGAPRAHQDHESECCAWKFAVLCVSVPVCVCGKVAVLSAPINPAFVCLFADCSAGPGQAMRGTGIHRTPSELGAVPRQEQEQAHQVIFGERSTQRSRNQHTTPCHPHVVATNRFLKIWSHDLPACCMGQACGSAAIRARWEPSVAHARYVERWERNIEDASANCLGSSCCSARVVGQRVCIVSARVGQSCCLSYYDILHGGPMAYAVRNGKCPIDGNAAAVHFLMKLNLRCPAKIVWQGK